MAIDKPNAPPKGPATRDAVLNTVAYAAWALFWIVVSDGLLTLYSEDIQIIVTLQWWKALIFVVVTAVLLYVLITRHSRQLIAANQLIAGHLETLTHDKAQLAHLTRHDALTGLPNRALLEDRLALALLQARRSDMRVALMHLDLDQFKLFNDSVGHQTGDSLLRLAAERFVGCLRAGDTVSRQGGDEFTMIFPDLESVDVAALIAKKLLDAMKLPFNLEGHEVFLTASVGIALFPDDGVASGELIRHADSAMYRAKQKGRDTFHFSTPDINAGIEERLRIESGMRNALLRDELRMVYQPQIDLKTGKAVGVEALLRWTSATLGVVSPERFIPIAEETGAIIPIGEWVLRAACVQARKWHEMGHVGMRVVVNLSARQFGSARMVEIVTDIARAADCPPHVLELEITESDVMRDPAATVEMIRQLKNLGISISIDDFGTGYSSLSYLKRFDADVLKIDKSFVRDIAARGDDAVIATSIIGLSHSLGMIVVAEGVEEYAQLAFLTEAGCDLVQGYLLSHPLEADQVSAFVNSFSLQEFQAMPTTA